MRHAFDADPIAAVDDTIHCLLRKGKRPLGAGWFFSLGHSTFAFALAPAIVPAAALVKQTLPVLQQHAGLIGAAVSGVFPWILGLLDLLVLLEPEIGDYMMQA